MNFLLHHIKHLLEHYNGQYPLANELKVYFKSHPKLGSRDRKAISEAIYTFYRWARQLPQLSDPIAVINQGLKQSGSTNAFLDKFLAVTEVPIVTKAFEKHAPLGPFSNGITQEEWLEHIQQQPVVFIRPTGKSLESIISKLEQAGVSYTVYPTTLLPHLVSISVPTSTPLHQLLQPNTYVVQDWASQQSLSAFAAHPIVEKANEIWDVCSGAGGKSLLLRQLYPSKNIFATDIRASILQNLEIRFKQYGFKKPRTAVVDSSQLSVVNNVIGSKKWDAIICDVPCSGSGTWARTPEHFHFFTEESLDKFRALQFPIAHNAAQHLNKGGIMAYITCSVFQEENELVVQRLINESNLQLIEQKLINGISHKADSLFVALFTKE